MSELTKKVRFDAKTLEVMSRPYTREEMLARKDSNNFISGIIRMEMSELINSDTESILDWISEALTGTLLLMDIEYEPIAVKYGTIYVSVDGDVSSILGIDSDIDDESEDADINPKEENEVTEFSGKTKNLEVTVECKAVYVSSIPVPSEMNFEEAIQYAHKHLDDIPLDVLEYVRGSDRLDVENCNFSDEDSEALEDDPEDGCNYGEGSDSTDKIMLGA